MMNRVIPFFQRKNDERIDNSHAQPANPADNIVVEYSPGLTEILKVTKTEGEYDTHLEMHHLSQIPGEDIPYMPILVFLNRKNGYKDMDGYRHIKEMCRDWWYFGQDNDCLNYHCIIDDENGEIVGGNKPQEKDISHLLQEKKLLREVQMHIRYTSPHSDYFERSYLNGLIKHILSKE